MLFRSKIQQQPVLKTNDAVSSDSSNTSESAVLGGRVFSSPVVPGAQWRAQTLAGFQNQSETVRTFAPVLFLNSTMLLQMLLLIIRTLWAFQMYEFFSIYAVLLSLFNFQLIQTTRAFI